MTAPGEERDPIRFIKEKCEQYWNEPGPFLPAEVHAILGFIWKEADAIEKRHAKAMAAEREAVAVKVSKLDPLLAIADWDNGDDIAYAVQSFIVANIRRGKDA